MIGALPERWQRGLAAGLAVVAVSAVATGQADARKATKSERRAMLAAWNGYFERYVDDPPACRNTWVTRVSAYRPRTGMIWANFRLRERYNCTLGDGWVILRRPTPTSERWRVATQGNDLPPCRYVTHRMARELGFPGCA